MTNDTDKTFLSKIVDSIWHRKQLGMIAAVLLLVTIVLMSMLADRNDEIERLNYRLDSVSYRLDRIQEELGATNLELYDLREGYEK